MEELLKDNVVANFIVGGLSAVAFILLIKMAVGYLPDTGIPGTIKTVITSI